MGGRARLRGSGEAAAEAAANELTETMADNGPPWSTDGSRGLGNGKSSGERVLSQEEIDNLLGFSDGEVTSRRSFRHSRHHRLGDGVLRASADARNRLRPPGAVDDDEPAQFHLRQRRSLARPHHLGAFRRLPQFDPAACVLSVFKAEEWENFGLFTVDSSLIYSMIDVLLGGRRGQTSLRIEGRPYTTIETNLVKRLVEVVLADAEQAFRPLSPVTFTIDRLETNPRFAAISRPANAAILVRLRIDMEDRGGNVELLLPYATIEPIRNVLLQMFMGEKFGRDPIWEGHLATEIAQAEMDVDAVLYEADMPLKQLMELKVGDTLPLDIRPMRWCRCAAATSR